MGWARIVSPDFRQDCRPSFARTVSPDLRQDCRPPFARTVVHLLPGLLALNFARTVSLRLTSYRIELTQRLLTNRFAACCLLHLSPTYESKLSTLSRNEEGPTLRVEPLWSRQESNLDLKFRKLLFYPLNYGTIPKRVAKIIEYPVPPQNACGVALFHKTNVS